MSKYYGNFGIEGFAEMTTELFSVDDIVATCLACGAYSITRRPIDIRHHSTCGGFQEVRKWEEYYADGDGEDQPAQGEPTATDEDVPRPDAGDSRRFT